MTRELGDISAGETLDFKFPTRDAGGAPITLAGTPLLRVYKNNSTAEDPDGLTLTVDFDGITGMHHVRIDTSADATFYSVGAQFEVVLTQGTVSGVSQAGEVLARFTIGEAATVAEIVDAIYDEPRAGHATSGTFGEIFDVTISSRLAPETAGRTLQITATGAAAMDWGSIENAGAAVSLAGTTIGAASSVTLDAASVDAIYDEPRAGHVTADTFGEVFDAKISSRLAPAVAGRTIDINAAGYPGIDWANIDNPDTEVFLSDTTISVAGQVNNLINLATNAINRAAFAPDSGLQSIRSGTAQAGGASTITLDAGASAVDDFYNKQRILITSGVGVGQSAMIVDYVGATKVATINGAWVTAPTNTSTFAIIPAGVIPLAATVDGRTLDVTATGAAGIDWSNVENPASVVGLTGTTIELTDDAVGSIFTKADAVEAGLTLAHALQQIRATTVGLVTTNSNRTVWSFRDKEDTKDRLVITVNEGERLNIVEDLD